MQFLRYFVLIFFFSLAFIPVDPIDNILQVFKRYQEELPQEKVYLHMDRSYYSSGDKIWLKAYLVAGAEHMPSSLSQTLYIELFDTDKKLIRQLKLLVNNGTTAGNIQIPDSLATGNYLIRAYTNWMRNSSDDYFFYQTLKVYNPQRQTPSPPTEGKIDLQFFPEGGDWVDGLKSKLALKAVGQDGLGKRVKGNIVDETGKVVVSFQSNFLGMGYCEMVPNKSHTYSAHLENGYPSFHLPAILDSGVTLSITQKAEQNTIVARIQNNTGQKNFYLIGQTRGFVAYASRVALPNMISFVKMTTVNFPTGVTQFTLVDEKGLPQAERLVFIDQHESLSIKIKPDKEIYEPREKVSMEIEVRDQDGKPTTTDLSLAVTDDEQAFPDVNRENIYSYLYLSSELKGHVESPGYYFNPENKSSIEDLDLLLLTQGWRRFNFQKAMDGSWTKPTFTVEQGLTIRGTMMDEAGKKVISGGKVKYLSAYPYPQMKVATTDEHGGFEIDKTVSFDSAKAMLQGETKYGHRTVKLLIDSITHIPPMSVSFLQGMELPGDAETNFIKGSSERQKINEAYKFDSKTILLEEISVTGKREAPVQDITKMYGPPSATIKVTGNLALENQQSVAQMLQGRVAGVEVTGQFPDFKITIRGTNSILYPTGPLILINNMPGSMVGLNPRDIKSINIFKGSETAIFGARAAGGAIVIYTKDGTEVFDTPEASPSIQFNSGYQMYRQFYSPRYEMRRPEHIKPDRRATLFWAPFVKTDSTGRATVTFYNHDLETSVTGIAEGLNAGGVPGTASITYAIKK